MKLNALLALCALTSTSLALGINCRGSGRCVIEDCGMNALDTIYDTLASAIEAGHGDRLYDSGKLIACDRNCCAFYQNHGQGTVQQTHDHIVNLQDHGCTGCGSSPVNGGEEGAELTVNYVAGARCEPDHLCDMSGR